MAIGNVPTVAQLNGQIAALATQYRTLAAQATELQAYVTGQGTAGLETLGFTAADAASFVTMTGYLNTLALIYGGQVQQGGSGGTGASVFDFGNALSAVTGPF
jgi:hypothetical protein